MNTQSPPNAPADAPGTSASHETPPSSNGSGADISAAKAFADAMARLAQIREYISYYLAIKADALRLSMRSAVFYAVIGLMGLLAAGAAIVGAVALLLLGAAHGLGVLLGGRIWLGDLIVGIVILGVLALAARIAISKVFGVSRKQTVEKYESRKRDQRIRFGHDINQDSQRQAR